MSDSEKLKAMECELRIARDYTERIKTPVEVWTERWGHFLDDKWWLGTVTHAEYNEYDLDPADWRGTVRLSVSQLSATFYASCKYAHYRFCDADLNIIDIGAIFGTPMYDPKVTHYLKPVLTEAHVKTWEGQQIEVRLSLSAVDKMRVIEMRKVVNESKEGETR